MFLYFSRVPDARDLKTPEQGSDLPMDRRPGEASKFYAGRILMPTEVFHVTPARFNLTDILAVTVHAQNVCYSKE